jgi:hypothetical protein
MASSEDNVQMSNEQHNMHKISLLALLTVEYIQRSQHHHHRRRRRLRVMLCNSNWKSNNEANLPEQSKTIWTFSLNFKVDYKSNLE